MEDSGRNLTPYGWEGNEMIYKHRNIYNDTVEKVINHNHKGITVISYNDQSEPVFVKEYRFISKSDGSVFEIDEYKFRSDGKGEMMNARQSEFFELNKESVERLRAKYATDNYKIAKKLEIPALGQVWASVA
jgi:hypothetical protein